MKAFRSKLEEILHSKRLSQKELKDIIDSQNDVGISQYMISLIVSGKKLNYVIGKRREGDVQAIYANNQKAQQLLEWEPIYNIEDMMLSAWKWEQNLQNNL